MKCNIIINNKFINNEYKVYSPPNNPNFNESLLIKKRKIRNATNPKAVSNTPYGLTLFSGDKSNKYT